MNPRKQRAMEEKHIKYSSAPKKDWDKRPMVTLEEVQIFFKKHRRWHNPSELESAIVNSFKNGKEMYQLAIQLEQSPLNQALL